MLLGVDLVGQHQHVAHETADERVQHQRRAPRIEPLGQQLEPHGPREIGVDRVQCLAHPRAVALQQRLQVRDVFALHEQDAEHAAQLRVALHAEQAPDQDLADLVERIAARRVERHPLQLVDRQKYAVEHCVEQFALVREMPVDCAARHAGMLRDVRERRVRHAFLEEHVLGGVENAIARLERLLLGTSDHVQA